jgi:ankyrin repeat protein
MSASDLLLAASVGDLQLLQQLLDGGLSPKAATPGGWTALHAAAMAGQLETMQLLIQQGAPVEAKTLEGRFVPLHAAARAGQTVAMQLLLSAKAGVNSADRKGDGPLAHAAAAGVIGSVQVLLDAGTDLCRVLPFAASQGDEQIVRLIISKCPNGCTKCDLSSALQNAAGRGHMQTVQVLLAAGGDVNSLRGYHRGTALHEAAWSGHDQIVQLLLANGADANAATVFRGETALHYAASRGHAKVVELLLAAGADLEHVLRTSGTTALHIAAAFGYVEVTALLISAGADVTARDVSDFTPLLAAARRGHAAVVRKLLAAGADVHAVSKAHQTPLMLAAEDGHLGVVEVLIRSGADSQQALVNAARRALEYKHMATWAFLARKVHGRYPQALGQCIVRMDAVAATRAMAVGWGGEIDRHEEVLESARVERAEGVKARQKADELIVQSALLQKKLGRSMSYRGEKAELVELEPSRSDR